MSNVDVYDDEPLLPDDDGDLAAAADDPDDIGADPGDDDDGALPADGDPTDRPRQPTRGQRRIQALNERARSAEERAARAEAAAELALRSITGRPTTDPAITARERQEHLDRLSPEERVDFLVNERASQFQNELQALRNQQWDANDRTEFLLECQANPVARRLRDEVEKRFQEENRNRPGSYGRMGILRLVLGDQVLKRTPKAAQRQRQAGAAAVARQTTRPASPRSDANAPTGRTAQSEREARRARLKDAVF